MIMVSCNIIQCFLSHYTSVVSQTDISELVKLYYLRVLEIIKKKKNTI